MLHRAKGKQYKFICCFLWGPQQSTTREDMRGEDFCLIMIKQKELVTRMLLSFCDELR